MPNSNTGAERLQAIVEQLSSCQPTPPPPTRVSAHLNDGISIVRYLGFGREMPSDHFGLFARGVVNNEAWLTHDLQLDFLSLDPDKPHLDRSHIRQKIGHVSLARSGDGLVNLSTSGFATHEGGSSIPIQTLASPLGEWATGAAASDIAVRAADKLAVQPARIEVTADQLEPIEAFLSDSANAHTYFRFEYRESGVVGVVTA